MTCVTLFLYLHHSKTREITTAEDDRLEMSGCVRQLMMYEGLEALHHFIAGCFNHYPSRGKEALRNKG